MLPPPFSNYWGGGGGGGGGGGWPPAPTPMNYVLHCSTTDWVYTFRSTKQTHTFADPNYTAYVSRFSWIYACRFLRWGLAKSIKGKFHSSIGR